MTDDSWTWVMALFEASAFEPRTALIMSPQVVRVGWTMKSMKPIWDWGTMVLCLSHRGENSKPLSRSISPCLKNSSMHREVHWNMIGWCFLFYIWLSCDWLITWWCRSQVLAGWETSHVCSSRLRTRVLSHVLPSWLADRRFLMCLSWEKCMDISIKIIMIFVWWWSDNNDLCEEPFLWLGSCTLGNLFLTCYWECYNHYQSLFWKIFRLYSDKNIFPLSELTGRRKTHDGFLRQIYRCTRLRARIWVNVLMKKHEILLPETQTEDENYLWSPCDRSRE